MTDELEHVFRSPIPWRREDPKTECGRGADTVKRAITLEQLKIKYTKLGQERTALTTCMTCFSNVRYSRGMDTWEVNPASVLEREIRSIQADPDRPINNELRAIAILIDTHRDEFDELLAGLENTVSLGARRRAARRGGR